MLDNPKRPPRGWFRRCVKGVQSDAGRGRGVRNANAVCGSLWYNKLGDSDRRRITREEEGYAENPTSGALVAGGIAAAAILAFVFWPKKAAAQASAGSACGSDHDVKSFIAAKGLIVHVVDSAPKSEVPPNGFDPAGTRVYVRSPGCSFYRWLALDGAMSTWQKDEVLNAQFAEWSKK